MRDYASLVNDLRGCSGGGKCLECNYNIGSLGCISAIEKDAADAIEELLAKAPHWISVEERKPIKEWESRKKGTDILPVLVYRKAASDWKKLYVTKAYFDGEYFVDLDNFILDVYVTHWMPLPEPPKEDA